MRVPAAAGKKNGCVLVLHASVSSLSVQNLTLWPPSGMVGVLIVGLLQFPSTVQTLKIRVIVIQLIC